MEADMDLMPPEISLIFFEPIGLPCKIVFSRTNNQNLYNENGGTLLPT
jgi:hypothetical protein